MGTKLNAVNHVHVCRLLSLFTLISKTFACDVA